MLLRVKLDGWSNYADYIPDDKDIEDFYGYIPDDKESCEDDDSFIDYLEEKYSKELVEANRNKCSLNDVLEGRIDYEQN
jgi:hypothetical protein